jgi:hypothetical protein
MSAEESTNPQIDHTDSTEPGESEKKKIDHLADDLANKAGNVQSKHDSTINDGGVSPGGGGIFSK